MGLLSRLPPRESISRQALDSLSLHGPLSTSLEPIERSQLSYVDRGIDHNDSHLRAASRSLRYGRLGQVDLFSSNFVDFLFPSAVIFVTLILLYIIYFLIRQHQTPMLRHRTGHEVSQVLCIIH
jgi:hypothetical protein